MGLLESVIGGVLGQVFGGGRGQAGGMSPLVKALLMLLLAKGASGGLGDIFGHGRGPRSEPGPEADRSGGAGPRGPGPLPGGGRDPGDIGGYDQWGGRRDPGPGSPGDPSLPGEGFDDLSGMLDGPGGPGPTARGDDAPGRGPMGGGREDDAGGDLGGLDGLVDRFRQGGLGDVIESWIGHGANRPVQPDQLARALGDDTLDTLERETGMDRAAMLSELSRALPEVVHALTPEGRIDRKYFV